MTTAARWTELTDLGAIVGERRIKILSLWQSALLILILPCCFKANVDILCPRGDRWLLFRWCILSFRLVLGGFLVDRAILPQSKAAWHLCLSQLRWSLQVKGLRWPKTRHHYYLVA